MLISPPAKSYTFHFITKSSPKVTDLCNPLLSVHKRWTLSDLQSSLPRTISSYPSICSGTCPISWTAFSHLQAIHGHVGEYIWKCDTSVIHQKPRTAFQYNHSFGFQKPMKVKVVKWGWNKWNEHDLMHIYHKQCEIIQKIEWNSSNGQIHCFHYVR